MAFKIEVEIEVPPYCAIPYNGVRCRFLERTCIRKLFTWTQKARCSIYDEELKQANDAFYRGSGILIPCDKCEEARRK